MVTFVVAEPRFEIAGPFDEPPTKEDDDPFAPTEGAFYRLPKVMAVGELKILGWRESKDPKKVEVALWIIHPKTLKKGWLYIKLGDSFGSITYSRSDRRADFIGTQKIYAPVLIRDLSMTIKSGKPKKYLILRSYGGSNSLCFYSDVPHPVIKLPPE